VFTEEAKAASRIDFFSFCAFLCAPAARLASCGFAARRANYFGIVILHFA